MEFVALGLKQAFFKRVVFPETKRPVVVDAHMGAENEVVAVADDGDFQSGQTAFAVANGQRVQQGLRRMFVCSVAGVDDSGFDDFGDFLIELPNSSVNYRND